MHPSDSFPALYPPLTIRVRQPCNSAAWSTALAPLSGDNIHVLRVVVRGGSGTSQMGGQWDGHNKFTTEGQKFATSQHLDMSRCWALAL